MSSSRSSCKEKYERHGGPTFAECYALLRDNSSQIPADVLSFLDWIGFNLAIGNNDSHAKNLSLIYENHSLRLAPYYDLISTALYTQYSPHFAFKIGEASSWDKVSFKPLEAFAKKIGVTVALIIRRWQSLFDRMESALQMLGVDYGSDPKLKKTLGKIEQEITKRMDSLRKNLERKVSDKENMPPTRLELVQPYGRRILSPVCLPFSEFVARSVTLVFMGRYRFQTCVPHLIAFFLIETSKIDMQCSARFCCESTVREVYKIPI